MITAVAFDLSGVLTPSPLAGVEAYTEQLGLPAGTLAGYIRGNSDFAAVETGNAKLSDFLDAMVRDVAERHEVLITAEAMLDAVGSSFHIVPAMLALCQELQPDHRLALLTNNVKESRSWWRRELPEGLFGVHMDSSEVGLRKPDPGIYLELLSRLERPASEVAFVDDFEENLPSAAELGIRTVHFRSPPQCRAALSDLGVPLSP